MKELVPELRFTEFKGEWEEKKLGEVITIFNGYAFKSLDSQKEGVRWFKIADVGTEKISEDNLSYLPNSFLKKHDKYVLRKNDVVIALTRPILSNKLKIAKIDNNANNSLLNQRVGKIISKENLNYLYQNLLTRKLINKIAISIDGNDPPNLSPKEIDPILVYIPSLPEQTKIADFLSKVDEQITLLTKKKEKLEEYKKGVMQKLFSQELRFKDENGNEYPEWEEKKLGDEGKIVNGLTYSPDDINDEGDLVLRSSNIQEGKLCFSDNVYVKVNKFNPVRLNDILICVRNGSKNLIGKNALITKEAEGNAFGAFMTVYRSKSNKFIYQWMQGDLYKKYINRNLGATINSINGSDLKSFKINLPSLPEQTKIANFLSAIDEQITVVEKQLAQSKTFKQGLLQKMFA